MVNCTAGHIAIKQDFDEPALKEDVKPPRVHDKRNITFSFFFTSRSVPCSSKPYFSKRFWRMKTGMFSIGFGEVSARHGEIGTYDTRVSKTYES
jgi:hypothetical protein